MRKVLLACVVLAALSLLLPSAPTYDPWSWIVWGREVAHLELDTTGGPSWKPLPVMFTTVFSTAGAIDDSIPPLLWLVVARLDRSDPVNVGVGLETRIRDLAETIERLVGFEGETVWDTSRPDGQPKRVLDTTRARDWFGFEASVPLEEGLERTIASFREQTAGAT